MLRAADLLIRTGEQAGRSYSVTAAGKKAVGFFRFRGREIDHTFGMQDRPSYEDARELAATVVPRFMAGDLDLVQLVSTRFVSAGTQIVEVRQLLPLESPDEPGGALGRDGFFEYEPSPEELLALVVPRYAEAALYQALLEASASEHVARQRAMSAATENADDLIKSLRRVMNRARQDSITTEIMEIVGGAEALRQGGGSEAAPAMRDDYSSFEEQTA